MPLATTSREIGVSRMEQAQPRAARLKSFLP